MAADHEAGDDIQELLDDLHILAQQVHAKKNEADQRLAQLSQQAYVRPAHALYTLAILRAYSPQTCPHTHCTRYGLHWSSCRSQQEMLAAHQAHARAGAVAMFISLEDPTVADDQAALSRFADELKEVRAALRHASDCARTAC